MGMGAPLPGAGDTNEEEDYTPSYSSTYTLDTNGLYLEITNVSGGWSYLNLHNATNAVYSIWSTTNLLTPLASGQVELELWPSGDQTNVMPFSIPNLGRQDLFLRAEDWTGIDTDGDGIPDWWVWKYFGNLSENATNLDGQGNTLGYDYANDITPTVFNFTGVEAANNHVSSSSTPVQLAVTGSPYHVAVLVDDTNFADAVWHIYCSSNLTVNLGMTEGWHDVWIGLRGHGDAATNAVWQWQRLKLDFTPPALTITSPTNGSVNVPVIQLTGFSPEALSSISYDLTNATGWVTNQLVAVEGQAYSTNTAEFTTNYFQAFDIPLTNGVNTLTLHATDLAGNVATLTTNFTCVASTNPPVVGLIWPQAGMEMSGSNVTIEGRVDDPTASVAVTTVAGDGNTNAFNGRTGRDGNFWIEKVPLVAGTNLLTLTVANAAGVTTTNFSLMQGDVNLLVNAVAAGDTNVTGSIDAAATRCG